MTFKTASAKAPNVSNEAPSAITASQATFKGTVNPNGAATTYRFDYVDAAHWALSHFGVAQHIPVPDQGIGSGTSPVAVSQTATGLQPHTLYHVRLKATNAEGIIDGENRTFTTPRSFQAPTYSSAFGSKGTGNGQFEEPRGIATDPSANVWVSDLSLNRVQKFNSKGEYVCQIGTKGTGNGQFSSPRGLAADAAGNVWVADSANNRIQEINSECKYVTQFGKAGSANGSLSSPRDVAVDPAGNLWVADSANARIEKFNSKGEYLAKCGSKGTGSGQFEKEALSVEADADGNVWAGDEAGRMERFDSKCAFLAKFDKTSSGAPAKVQPAPSAIDPEGNLWIPSAEAHAVQGFYPEGEYLASFGKEGTGTGQFTEPTAIAAAPDGTLWAIDHSATANRVEKWVPGKAYPVITGRATAPKRTETTLTGKVNPEGKATSYQFEYGTTAAFGNVIPATPKSVGSGSSPVAASELLDALKAGTTYYYHLVAIAGTTVTYGETRHFSTLAKPGPNAKWRIGGKTFAELGLEKVSFGSNGQLTIRLSIVGLDVRLDCTETSSGTLTASGVTSEKVRLECVWVGASKECTIKPVEYTVNASYTPESPVILSLSSGCNFFEGQLPLEGLSGSFEYGSEAKTMNATATATAAFGKNPETITSDGHWFLTAEQVGKTLGIEEGPPEVFTQAASKVGPAVATLNGTVNPLGQDTSYRFEYGPTTSYGTTTAGGEAGSGTTALSKTEAIGGLTPSTTYHFRIAASSGAGTSYGKDQAFTTPAQPNPNWRIEGSTLEELEAWGEPYESKGKFEVQSMMLGLEMKITCSETGSGTLGYQETMNLSACEIESKGVKQGCNVKVTQPIELDSGFHSKGTVLTTFKTEGCIFPESIPVKAGPGLAMKAGAEAVEFPASMSEETYVGAETAEHKAQVLISSVWKLTGTYKAKKFAYAEPSALNTKWHIKGSTLAALGAWEPYESKGNFEVQSKMLGLEMKITCSETGSGTLGYQETMNLSACEIESKGVKQGCNVKATQPIKLDGGFHSENTLLTTFKTEGCIFPESIPVKAGPGLTMKAGAEAVEFPASMSEESYVGAETAEHKAQVLISSVWKLTGKYKGSKFGYE
jgi:streptogramin lyase